MIRGPIRHKAVVKFDAAIVITYTINLVPGSLLVLGAFSIVFNVIVAYGPVLRIHG